MLSGSTKCIEGLLYHQLLHATIIRWLKDAIEAKILNVMEWPLIREEKAWLVRPFEGKGVFRSYYICHIIGMELGCLESETQSMNCGRERGDGSRIEAL